MPVKSIIDIDINDTAFLRFTAMFDKYQAALKKSPAEWAKITEGIGRSRKDFDGLVRQQIAALARTKLMAEAQREAERATRSTADRWRDISRSTREVAGNIASATANILRWGALTGVVSGLLGAGGLFGFNHLALGVSNTRRSALGLGAGYGEQRSFGANFGRLVDPGSFLSAVANAKMDVGARTGLYGAGLSEAQMRGSTGEVSVALIQQLKRIADTTDPTLFAQTIQARNLGQFTSPEDLQRLRATSGKELEGLYRGFRSGSGAFNLSEDSARAWQEFTTQLGRASEGIENTFVKGLVRLTPGLEKISVGFEKVVRALFDNEHLAQWLDKANEGLEKFAGYIGTPEFEENVRDFVSGIANLVKAIGSAVSWFASSTRLGGLSPEDKKAEDDRAARIRKLREDRASGKSSALGQLGAAFSNSELENYIREGAIKRKLDPDVAVAVAKSEGLYGNYAGDRGSSFGPFQLHYGNVASGGMAVKGLGDDFTKATGLDARNPNTVKQQADFALDYAKQNGWGPWHGWKGSPNAGGAGVKVTIENNTGGNAIVTTNQVAQ